MFKAVIMAKRKPGMSLAAFRDYYEGHHAPLAISQGSALQRYKRTYLTPADGVERAYDVITEIWFASEAAFHQTFAELEASPERAAVIAADEENFFDRPTISFFLAEEYESDLDSPTR